MKNSPNCPVCQLRLEDEFVLCPQCGNSEIEYLDRIDGEDAEKYKSRLEMKRAAWTSLAGEKRRLTDALTGEKQERVNLEEKLHAVGAEVGGVERQLKDEKTKREDLEKQIDRLTNELL